jgi:acyl-CoA-binding protein
VELAAKQKPLEGRFADAQKRVQKLSQRPSNDKLLELYALYKQATEGDVKGARPGLLDLKGRAKYDAWAGRKGVSGPDAMKRYVALVEELEAEG